MKFDKKLLNDARQLFYCVYVDKLSADKTTYAGSTTATEGDRVRIYPTSWDYETDTTFNNNEELKTYIDEYINSEIECYAISGIVMSRDDILKI